MLVKGSTVVSSRNSWFFTIYKKTTKRYISPRQLCYITFHGIFTKIPFTSSQQSAWIMHTLAKNAAFHNVFSLNFPNQLWNCHMPIMLTMDQTLGLQDYIKNALGIFPHIIHWYPYFIISRGLRTVKFLMDILQVRINITITWPKWVPYIITISIIKLFIFSSFMMDIKRYQQ